MFAKRGVEMKEMRFAWAPLDGRCGHEVGRQLLRELYRDETGEECPKILTTARGKPYFENSPLHFSISHTKKHAFCALAQWPVGIDAEEMDRRVDLRLADKILSEPERMRYDAADDKRTILLRLWVLKEATVKLTGEGLRGFPNHTDFSSDDARILEIDGCYVAVLEEKDHAF